MNKELEKKLWQKAEKYISKLQSIPFIKMVAVCNSLAMEEIDQESDIDLFIVAKKNRLFLVRSLVSLKLHFLGVRRHGKKIKERFCLSFFIEESANDFSKIAIEDDIYLASWINSLKPVLDTENYLKNFRKKNHWINPILKKWQLKSKIIDRSHLQHPTKFQNKITKLTEKLLSGKFGNSIEQRLQDWQLKRASSKTKPSSNSGVIINSKMLKFHQIDRRQEYKESLLRLLP